MPSTIGTTSESLALGSANCHLAAYSSVSGSALWYMVYNDGSNWVYRTSSDGVTWSSATTVTGVTGDPGGNMGTAGLTVDSGGVLHFITQKGNGDEIYTQLTASGWWATPTTVVTGTFTGATDGMYEGGGHKYIWMWGYSSGSDVGGDVAQDPTSSSSLSTFGFGLNSATGSSWANRNRSLGIEFYGTSAIVLGVDQAATHNLGYHTFDPTALTTGQFPTASVVVSNASLDQDFASGVDSGNAVHVFYRIAGTGWLEAVWNGTSWTTGGTLPQLTDNDRTPTLALDANGTLHCFYARFNATNDYGIGHLTFSGGSWTAQSDLVTHNSVNRTYVGVSRKPGNSNMLVYWLEGTGSPFSVVGTLVASVSASTPGFLPSLWPPQQAPRTQAAIRTPVRAPYRLATPTGFAFPVVTPAAGGSIVSGGGTLIGNGALVETAAQVVTPTGDTLAGNGVLALSAGQIVAPVAPLVGQGVLSETAAQIVSNGDVLAGNGVLAAPAQIVSASAALTGQGILSAPAHVVSDSAALIGQGVLTETAAQIVAPAALLIGQGILTESGAILTAHGDVLQGNGILSANLISGGGTLGGNGGLSATAQIVEPAAPLVGSGSLTTSGASLLTQAALAGNGAATLATAVLIAAADALLTGNGVLAATGGLLSRVPYHSPVGTTASAATRLTGATVLSPTELVGTTAEE